MNLQQLYINGTFIDSKSTEMIDVINPATEKVISQIVDATAVETNQAIEAAWHGQKEWEKVPQVEREELYVRLAMRLPQTKSALQSC